MKWTKGMAVMLTAGLALGSAALPAAGQKLTANAAYSEDRGDLNGDGVIDREDARTLAYYLTRLSDDLVRRMQYENADIDGDGKVDLADYQHLVNYIRYRRPFPDSSVSEGYDYDNVPDDEVCQLSVDEEYYSESSRTFVPIRLEGTAACALLEFSWDAALDFLGFEEYRASNGVELICNNDEGVLLISCEKDCDLSAALGTYLVFDGSEDPRDRVVSFRDCMLVNERGMYLPHMQRQSILRGSAGQLPAFTEPYETEPTSATTTTTTAVTLAPDTAFLGDVNGDGKVNDSDLFDLEDRVAYEDLYVYTPAADMNRDGRLSEEDCDLLRERIWSGAPAETVNVTETYTTTTTTEARPINDCIQFELIPRGMEYGYHAYHNTVTVKPGSTLTVDWTVQNDSGTAMIGFGFDFSQLTFLGFEEGTAYDIAPLWIESTHQFLISDSVNHYAKDGAVVASFTFRVPETEGTYTIGTDSGGVSDETGTNYTYSFFGLIVTVAEDAEDISDTTESTTTTTTTSEETTTTTTTTTTPEETTTTTTTTTTPEKTTTTTTTTTTSEETTTTTTTTTSEETTTTTTTTTTSEETTTTATTTTTPEETTTTTTTTTTSEETTTTTTTTTSEETTTTTTTTSEETTTTTTATSDARETAQIASDEELLEWAKNDYLSRKGITVSASVIEKSDGKLTVQLTDESGNPVDTYVIDTATGVGTDAASEEINLPQTGNLSLTNLLVFLGAFLLIGTGAAAVFASGALRRRKQDL